MAYYILKEKDLIPRRIRRSFRSGLALRRLCGACGTSNGERRPEADGEPAGFSNKSIYSQWGLIPHRSAAGRFIKVAE
jgi:hypothetical protein